MISLHWHLTPRLKFLYVLHELLLLCGKYYILYNIRRSAFGAARQSILLLEMAYLRLLGMKQYWFSHFIH